MVLSSRSKVQKTIGGVKLRVIGFDAKGRCEERGQPSDGFIYIFKKRIDVHPLKTR